MAEQIQNNFNDPAQMSNEAKQKIVLMAAPITEFTDKLRDAGFQVQSHFIFSKYAGPTVVIGRDFVVDEDRHTDEARFYNRSNTYFYVGINAESGNYNLNWAGVDRSEDIAGHEFHGIISPLQGPNKALYDVLNGLARRVMLNEGDDHSKNTKIRQIVETILQKYNGAPVQSSHLDIPTIG